MLHNTFTNNRIYDIIYQCKNKKIEELSMAKVTYTLEQVQLKYQTMKKRISTLRNAFGVISDTEMGETAKNKLDELEIQYDRMYEEILRQGNYASYEEVEKSIIYYLARIEGKLEEYVYHRKDELEPEMTYYIKKIPDFRCFQDFKDMDRILKMISGLEELLRQYSGYCTKEQFQDLQTKISDVKFDCLLRAQVELIAEDKRYK